MLQQHAAAYQPTHTCRSGSRRPSACMARAASSPPASCCPHRVRRSRDVRVPMTFSATSLRRGGGRAGQRRQQQDGVGSGVMCGVW